MSSLFSFSLHFPNTETRPGLTVSSSLARLLPHQPWQAGHPLIVTDSFLRHAKMRRRLTPSLSQAHWPPHQPRTASRLSAYTNWALTDACTLPDTLATASTLVRLRTQLSLGLERTAAPCRAHSTPRPPRNRSAPSSKLPAVRFTPFTTLSAVACFAKG